jgi:tRNA pseudouridine55 synthase
MLDAGCWIIRIEHPASSIEHPAVYFGILNVNKPPGLSSRDVVDRVERLVRPAKCGHAGTLDPLATGVLVICVGPATRLIQYVQRMQKQYRATFLLGRQSETDDIEGDVTLLEGAPQPTRAQIDDVLLRFVGQIQQRPPAHSAIKVAGRRAYALARRGLPVELAARPVTIHALTVRQYKYPELELDLECGSGTYVRALGRDLAAALGTAAVMSALERIAIGGFRVDHAVRLDELTAGNLLRHLQPALAAVAELPRIMISDAELARLRNGLPISLPPAAIQPNDRLDGEWAAMDPAGCLAAIVFEKRQGELWPALNLV